MLGLQIKLGKGDWIMEKKEILKRAQDEKLDERELQVKDKSMMWSYIVMVIMASVFSFIRSEQGLPMMDLCATVSGSVCAAMTYRFIKTRNIEHLIIDGASTDGTLELIKEYENKGWVKLYSKKDSGIDEAYDNATKLATGEYLAWMNSDDKYYSNDAIEKSIKKIQKM
mgnify:CR=1 FL=1